MGMPFFDNLDFETLAAVAGLWVCDPFQPGPAEPGLLVDWERKGDSA